MESEEGCTCEPGAKSFESYHIHVLFYPEAGGAGPQQYLDGYKNLKEWVHSSLDLYKSELERILYPVFVHCYLDLVERGYNEHAARLLKEYRIDHEEQHGTEVKQLAGISQAAHVANDASRRTHGSCF